jgi:hypothetical protein
MGKRESCAGATTAEFKMGLMIMRSMLTKHTHQHFAKFSSGAETERT